MGALFRCASVALTLKKPVAALNLGQPVGGSSLVRRYQSSIDLGHLVRIGGWPLASIPFAQLALAKGVVLMLAIGAIQHKTISVAAGLRD